MFGDAAGMGQDLPLGLERLFCIRCGGTAAASWCFLPRGAPIELFQVTQGLCWSYGTPPVAAPHGCIHSPLSWWCY